MAFDKSELLTERGQFCECGCGLYAHDAHHALIPNLKRFSEYVNDKRNIILVNHDEHISRKFDCHEWRVKFYKRQVLRYGQEAMDEWVNSLPAKMKHRITFIQK